MTATKQATDNRPALAMLSQRPETTAIVGTVVVFIYFAVAAGSNGFLSLTATRTTWP